MQKLYKILYIFSMLEVDNLVRLSDYLGMYVYRFKHFREHLYLTSIKHLF